MVGLSNFNAVTGTKNTRKTCENIVLSGVREPGDFITPTSLCAVLVYHVHNPKTENVSITANINEHLVFMIKVYYYKLYKMMDRP